mmetsp:Transcript_42258/g.111617  ORF Transcript_42258/g.111617 Transcript_42258/m.111617 type:complete len:294 (-) Transcript_42258:554-1435(-)
MRIPVSNSSFDSMPSPLVSIKLKRSCVSLSGSCTAANALLNSLIPRVFAAAKIEELGFSKVSTPGCDARLDPSGPEQLPGSWFSPPNNTWRMLRKRCRTLRRASSRNRLGSERFNARKMSARRMPCFLPPALNRRKALLASLELILHVCEAACTNSRLLRQLWPSTPRASHATVRLPYLFSSRSRRSSSNSAGETAARALPSSSRETEAGSESPAEACGSHTDRNKFRCSSSPVTPRLIIAAANCGAVSRVSEPGHCSSSWANAFHIDVCPRAMSFRRRSSMDRTGAAASIPV